MAGHNGVLNYIFGIVGGAFILFLYSIDFFFSEGLAIVVCVVWRFVEFVCGCVCLRMCGVVGWLVGWLGLCACCN